MNPHSGPNATQRLTETEQEKLVAYLDGELDDAAERQVVAELGVRPELRSEAESLRKTWDLLDFLPKPAPPPQFTERTMHRLQATKALLVRRERLWKRIAVAGWIFTLALVAMLCFWIVYNWPTRDRAAGQDPKAETRPEGTLSAPADPRRLEPLPDNLREEERLHVMVRQEINRMVAELNAKGMEQYERTELFRKRREGGLIFMEELLNLAKKYNVPLQRPLPPRVGGGPPLGREEEPPALGANKPKRPPGKAGEKPQPTPSKPAASRPSAPTSPGAAGTE